MTNVSSRPYRALLCVALALLPACARAAPYSRMVVFGDSYEDEGNSYAPPPGYYLGRYSNGPVWVEDLAPKLGVPTPDRSAVGGSNATNFAYAGAPATGTFNAPSPDLATEVSSYLARGRPTGNELVVIKVGGVDMQFGPANPALASGAIKTQINRLAGQGAKSFLVVNTPPLGSLPHWFGADKSRLNDLANRFNQSLLTDVNGVRTTLGPGVDIRFFDMHEVFAEVLANPQSLGFTNVTQGALNVGARDPDKYLFLDDFHPTRNMHQLLADRAYLIVPEPSALGLMGLCGLTLLRRRNPAARAVAVCPHSTRAGDNTARTAS